MKRWKVIAESRIKPSVPRTQAEGSQESRVSDVIKILLENRGLKTKKEIDEFVNPKLEDITINNLTIDSKQLNKAVLRIKNAIKKGENIVVFGDYDVDGICGTAILWETLRFPSLAQGKPYDNVFPYIPHRIDEGYGLSIKGIQNVQDKYNNLKLIITVDNGIVANKAVEFAIKQGIDVVITDHHVPSKKLPDAFAIVHTTKLCGAGVAWMLAQSLLSVFSSRSSDRSRSVLGQSVPINGQQEDQNLKTENRKPITDSHLELVALATVADLVPLIGANRTLLKFGLEQLRKTRRVGLKELFEEAGIEQEKIGVYEIGHIIAPRLNAMGRLDYAMDSLRLLCTNNRERAKKLALLLGGTNRERRELTFATVNNSKLKIQNSKLQFKNKKLLFIADKSYEQGIIGLVAGKLVEEFYKPAIVVSIGEKYSKASARSVSGFNIIEFIRSASELLVDAGGHPMAAGFTVETVKLSILQKTLEDKALELLDEEMLTRTLRIDCEIPLDFVNNDLYDEIQKLSPFGMGNPEPTFVSRNVVIEDMRLVGREGKHVKLKVKSEKLKVALEGIAFGMGERASGFSVGVKVDIAYTIDEDTWNGNNKLQLKVKDIRK